MAVHLIHNIHLRQQNKVIIPEMQVLDGLGEAEAPDVPDIVCPKVDYWGSGRPAPWRPWRRVESVAATSKSLSEVMGIMLDLIIL